MTPAEIYALVPERVTHDIQELLRHQWEHIDELAQEFGWMTPPIAPTPKIEIRVVKEFSYDGRRTWELRTVWFEGKPVMIVQNAGREGDDFVGRFVTDAALYREMVRYLRANVIREAEDDVSGVVDPHVDLPALTFFYEQDLKGPFKTHAQRYYEERQEKK